MPTLSESARQGDILRWELHHEFSRENVTVVAAAALKIGAILAQRTKSTVTPTKKSGTGDGALGTWTLGASAMPGIYKLTCIATATNAGTFSVLAPDGGYLPNLTVAVAYVSDHINGTLADGAADWGLGAVIEIAVTGDGKYLPASYGAVDGTGEACAILLNDTAITTGKILAILRRFAILVPGDLIYDSSYDSAPKKAVAVAQLKALSNILVVPATSYV
jgi:hypothetical protein